MEEGRFPCLVGQGALTQPLRGSRGTAESLGRSWFCLLSFVTLVGEPGVQFEIGHVGHFYESICTNKPMGSIPNINSLSYCCLTFI